MNVTEPFVLRSDVLLVPCADLSDDVRARISFEESDYTLSRRHGRTPAQVIDAESAALLGLFREPRTIADAVIENSCALGKDPRRWLDELLPHLAALVDSRVLVPAGAEEEMDLHPRLGSGAEIAGWTIVRCASLIEDTEIHELRKGGERAALKIARLATPMMQTMFENEIAVLRHLAGAGIAPRLIETGVHEERPWAIMEWAPGVDAEVAGAQRRHDRGALIDLCASIAKSYAQLHAHGVVHADVHPRNVLVDGDRVTLLDFGYSRLAGHPNRIGRAGMPFFYQPELLAAWKEGKDAPASEAGEQYSLAALLYLLITGRHYLDFHYDRDEMHRQIENDPPLPFVRRDVPPWPDVERIVVRALEKNPVRRHGSVAEMAAILGETREAAARESLATPLSGEAYAFLENTLRSFARGGSVFGSRFPPPTASIRHGCAGAAVGLLRIACTRSDPEILALADIWRSRAVALIGTEGAYYWDESAPSMVGDANPYHTESGIHAAAAMVAAVTGNKQAQRHAIEGFVRASRKPCTQLDLTLGRSGSLLAAALLLAISEDLPEASASLRAFGSETMAAIWSELDSHPPLEECPGNTFLGIAHGWAGYIYAALRWCEASGDAPPARLLQRLQEYVPLRTPDGRGIYWRATLDRLPDNAIATWCNGSAGTVFLFTVAHRLFGDDRLLELAELSAWHAWDARRFCSTLCCGTTGRAYALLNLYRHTGNKEWLSRARQLANYAVGASDRADSSLYRGALGVATLIADLASPENARMPFFE